MAEKFLEDAEVVANEQLASCIWRLTLRAPKTAAAILPGQFVHMQVDGGQKAMLRRPFSVFDAMSDTISIIYEVKGKGTVLMTAYKIGDKVSLIAPCGNSWLTSSLHLYKGNKARATDDKVCEMSSEALLEKLKGGKIGSALLVGGGVGSAPLYMLAKRMIDNNVKVDVVLGARTKDLLVLEDSYEQLGVRHLVCATDDGSYGEAGFCTVPAEKFICENAYDYVATCGPTPVMQKVAHLSKNAGVPCEVSCEERMACGVGACKTCVVNTVNGKVKSCECGPVFDAEVISW